MQSEKLEYKLQSFSKENQKIARQMLTHLFKTTPLPDEHLLVNLGLYQRSSVVAKFLYLNELYQHVVKIPGVIMEFGVWWGQSIVQFENLRAVYEPYNHNRKIVGFDTFTGYPEPSTALDGKSELVKQGQYAVTDDYLPYLEALLDYHGAENTMSHVKKYELVKGDASKTIQTYLNDHPETIIALAFLDMQLYEPTKAVLQSIQPYLVKGSVIAMDEVNCPDFPGETVAFRETIGLSKFKAYRSQFLPDRTYFVVD
jgi:hypothetical protein